MGRKKGSKDKKPRSKMGYIARYEKQKRKGETWYQREKRIEKEKLAEEERQRLMAVPRVQQLEELERKEAELRKLKMDLGFKEPET